MLTAVILSLSTVATAILGVRTAVAFHASAYRPSSRRALGELPSVSVCIAARNETHALAQCLERVLESDYRKLEVLVLDDSSSDDTSYIIKSFANAGVRFIAGKPLPSGWLGKNHAYQTLLDEASGDHVLFLDVDTTIAPTTISQLVNIMASNKVSMLSVLPRRQDSYHASAILGTQRYYWELLLGRKGSPAAASALWMTEKSVLKNSADGFGHYSLSIRPERHLARRLSKSNQYVYILGTHLLGVGFEKKLSSQYQTATRLYYPMSGRSLIGLLGAACFLLLTLAPVLLVIMRPFASDAISLWALLLVIAISVVFAICATKTYGPVARPVRVMLWPILTTVELILLVRSFLAYSFGVVRWKGRAVNAGPDHAEALRIDT